MKALTVILFCSWKFAMTFPIAVYGFKMTFFETILYTNIGGVAGVLFFALLSNKLIEYWKNKVSKRKKRKVFTPTRRKIVKLRSRYGLWGIVILNPIIISIPVSTFLVSRYYGKQFTNYAWLILGQIGWSFVYTYFYMFIKQVVEV